MNVNRQARPSKESFGIQEKWLICENTKNTSDMLAAIFGFRIDAMFSPD